MSEILSAPEQALPAKKTIEQFETKLLETGSVIKNAQSKVDALNFKSDATDHVMAKAELRDTELEYQPQLDALSIEWSNHGGARLDAARAAVDALNFKSGALDRVAATKELQSAEDAWVESYTASKNDQSVDIKDAEPAIAGVGDIVKVGKNGNTYHKPDGSFISTEHMKLIETHQDQILSGLEGRKAETSAEVAENEVAQQAAAKDKAESTDGQLDLSGLDEKSNVADAVENKGPDTKSAEKKSIWSKISEKTTKIRDRIYTTYGLATYGVGRRLSGPQLKEGESQEDYEKRSKKYGNRVLLGTAAIIGVAILAKYGIDHDLFGGNDTGLEAGTAPDNIDTPEPADPVVDEAPAVETPAPFEFSSEAHTVTDGEGWYNTFKEMGITDSTEQAALLQKVGPQLQEMGYAYPMGETSWGISQPGQLPNDVLELIKNSR